MIVWTIYYNPDDYPNLYVCRMFDKTEPTTNMFKHRDIEKVRLWLVQQANSLGHPLPVKMDRHPNDAIKIVETWL